MPHSRCGYETCYHHKIVADSGGHPAPLKILGKRTAELVKFLFSAKFQNSGIGAFTFQPDSLCSFLHFGACRGCWACIALSTTTRFCHAHSDSPPLPRWRAGCSEAMRVSPCGVDALLQQ